MPPKNSAISKKGDESESLQRIAIVNPDKCRPKKCKQECKLFCPVVRGGQECIQVSPADKLAIVSEELCIGCGICTKKCPFGALNIINLPKNLSRHTTHRYGPNSFKLHRLPLPRAGQILGLVGPNGTGKSTALKILEGRIKPNLGCFTAEPSWDVIQKYFRGSEHQAFFQRLIEDKIVTAAKPQYVDELPRLLKGTVRDILQKADEREMMDHYVKECELQNVLDRDISVLSGGELQRLAIAMTCLQKADVYMFDEPSSYLDVRQRLAIAEIIRKLVTESTFIIVIEHDLAVLDYLSDFICVLYGVPGAYGVVTAPFSVLDGINIFLEGFIPTENLRFREASLNFKMADAELEMLTTKHHRYSYPNIRKTMKTGGFELDVESGMFTDSEVIVLLGENGTGKTTLIRMLAGVDKPDEGSEELPKLVVSYKPQKIAPKFPGSVKELLSKKIFDAINHAQFQTDVLRPLCIDELMDLQVLNLSGGELQRVAITLALGTPADVYLIDEPSAYLDSEQRLNASRVIKRFILHSKKSAFIVEHDFIMATYLADKVILFKGEPGKKCTACSPQLMLDGMNSFLKQLNVTIRRDPTNYRPRVNKPNSVKDREQKECANYFYSEAAMLAHAQKPVSSEDNNTHTHKGQNKKNKA